MNERQMTHQESLAIISTMIALTQQKMQQSGKGQDNCCYGATFHY